MNNPCDVKRPIAKKEHERIMRPGSRRRCPLVYGCPQEDHDQVKWTRGKRAKWPAGAEKCTADILTCRDWFQDRRGFPPRGLPSFNKSLQEESTIDPNYVRDKSYNATLHANCAIVGICDAIRQVVTSSDSWLPAK